jgi:catechol 2,3-dioxygenase-like lactoylglutathione lyase family enzyme
MTNQQPVLDLLDFVARDMDATLTFYRRLGLEIPDGAVSRTASGAHHVDVDLPNGFHLHFDSVALAKSFNRGWPEQAGAGPRTIIGFSVSSREAVDDRYADLVAAGYTGRQPPYDAFWGARYAVIEDPDGNHVGLMSPVDREAGWREALGQCGHRLVRFHCRTHSRRRCRF